MSVKGSNALWTSRLTWWCTDDPLQPPGPLAIESVLTSCCNGNARLQSLLHRSFRQALLLEHQPHVNNWWLQRTCVLQCRQLPVVPSMACKNALSVAFLVPAAFPGSRATVACVGSSEEKAASGLQPVRHHTLRVRFNGIANPCIRRIFADAGFVRTSGQRWNVLWGAPLRKEAFQGLDKFQRCNHFPGTWELGRKDSLYKFVARLCMLPGI